MRPIHVLAALAYVLSISLCLAATAQSLSQPKAPVVEGTIKPPFSHSFRFGASVAPVGEKAVFSINGRIEVDFHRLSGITGPARITLVLRDVNRIQTDHWSLAPPVRQQISLTKDGPHELEVHVIDGVEGGDNLADTIMLNIRALDADSAVSLVSGYSLVIHPQLLSASCTRLARLPAAATFVNVGGFNIAEFDSDVSDIHFVPGGRKIALSISPFTNKQASAVDISIFVKTLLGGFTRACHLVRITPDDRTRTIIASLTTPHPRLIWRVETTVSKPRNSKVAPIAVHVNSARDEFVLQGMANRNKLGGYLCGTVAAYRGMTDEGQRKFAKKVLLNVDLNNPEFPLTSKRRVKLVETILDAVQLWVEGCNTCRPDHLVVVEIDKVLYANMGVLGLTDTSLENEKLHKKDANNVDIEGQLKLILNGVPLFPGFADSYPSINTFPPMMFPYRQLRPTDKFTMLCSLHTVPEITPLLHSIRNVVCDPTHLDPSLTSNIKVKFRPGKTVCGDDKNIIACRADHELTEYNVRDYTFRTDDAKISIGKGPIRLDLVHVLAHEIGHWIGLEHTTEGDSMMADSYEQSRCIGTRDAKAIAAAPPAAVAGPLAFTLRATTQNSHSARRRRARDTN